MTGAVHGEGRRSGRHRRCAASITGHTRFSRHQHGILASSSFPRKAGHMSIFDQPLEPDPVIEVYKKDIDWTLVRENLKLTHEDRLIKLMQLQRFADELREAGRRARRRST